jgi:hypothetical protein
MRCTEWLPASCRLLTPVEDFVESDIAEIFDESLERSVYVA